jgi:hypothetical protein
LATAIDSLTETMRVKAPDALNQLRPGLNDAALDQLQARLGRYHLPAELRGFYRWQNGHDYDGGLMPGYELDSLSIVVDRQMRNPTGQNEFPPQWLQLGTMNGGYFLMAAGAYHPQEECPVMVLDLEGAWLCSPWASIADFLNMVRDCYAEDVYRRNGEGRWDVPDQDAEQQIWRRHHRPTVIDGMSLPWEMNPNDSDAWPASWRIEAGINEQDEILRAATKIAEFNVDNQPCTISGRVTWLAGTATGSVVVADDGSGQVTLGVPRTVPGARYLQMRKGFQWDVEPGPCPPSFAFLPGGASVTAVALRMRRLNPKPGSGSENSQSAEGSAGLESADTT